MSINAAMDERSTPQMVQDAVAAEAVRGGRRFTAVVAVVVADLLLMAVAPVAGLGLAPVALLTCAVHASLVSILRDARAASWHLEEGTVTVGRGTVAQGVVTVSLASGERGRLIRGHVRSPVFSQQGQLAIGSTAGRPSLAVTYGNSRIFRIRLDTSPLTAGPRRSTRW